MSNPTMRTLRFHAYGAPGEVLQLEHAPVPSVPAGRVRVAVHACALNPADWALCRGLFPGTLPRGVGLDVAGVVDAVGEGVTDVSIGDRVAGSADFAGAASAGASDVAILDSWARLPANLEFVAAAALPMAVETASRHLDAMRLAPDQTLLVNGAGTSIGFAAVQIALARGARVVATAGETYADRLRAVGAKVTSYGEGMASRTLELAGGPVDLALDTAPAPADPDLVHALVQGTAERNETRATTGPLAEIVRAAGGDARRVVTISDFEAAVALGVRTTFDVFRDAGAGANAVESREVRSARLADSFTRAANGNFGVPVARTFPLEDWRAAMEISLGGRAKGKLVLLFGR